MSITLAEFIRDLEALDREEMSCSSFREKYLSYPEGGNTSMLPSVLGNLHHYVDDEDWRKKDEWQRDMQKAELRRLIKLLKEGAAEAEIQKISFLGKT